MAFAGGTSIVTACDQGATSRVRTVERSGMASPMRTDDEPIRVKVRDTYMVISANCFDSPLEAETPDDHGYVVTGTVLLAMLHPTLECRTKLNRRAFLKTGASGPRMSLLISSLGPGRKINEVFDATFGLRTTNSFRAHSPMLLVSQDTAEAVYSMRAMYGSDPAKLIIYKSKAGDAFTVCNHPIAPLIPACRLEFIYGSKIVSVQFAGAFAERRDSIRTAVSQALNAFRARAEADRAEHSRLNSDASP